MGEKGRSRDFHFNAITSNDPYFLSDFSLRTKINSYFAWQGKVRLLMAYLDKYQSMPD